MKKNRRHTIAAVTAGLIAGGAVGFVAGVPALTSAADVTIDSTVDNADADHDHGERRGPGGRGGRGGEQMATVAEVIGVDAEALREAFAAGQSVADVAEANGVALDDVVAAVVAEMETHIAEHVAEGKLAQSEADAKLADAADKVTERLSSVPAERGMGERGRGDLGGRRGPGGRSVHGPHGVDHDETAEVTTNA